MNYFELAIKNCARRIKKIEESPDPMYLKSNKLYYELEKEQAEAYLDAWRQGRPVVSATLLERLLASMGIQWLNTAFFADHSAGRFSEYKTTIERLGFPEQCCDRTVAQLAMLDRGEVPKPHFMILTNLGCDAETRVHASVARWFDIPTFYIDSSLNAEDKPNLDSLNYLTDQLGELIEEIEKKIPGAKYDEDRLIEIQEMDAIGTKYLLETYQLRKQVPCPIAPLDAFRVEKLPRRYRNMQKANEYLRAYRDELGERVASGKGPYPEERLRLLWAASGPYYGNPFRLLMERKVAMPVMYHGGTTRYYGLRYKPYGEVSEYGVKLSPLQEEARWMDTNSWGGPAKRWVTDVLDCTRDLGAHGIVHYLQVGCTPVLGLTSMLAEKAEKELGIPMLNIEGRQMDPDYMSQAQLDEMLSGFIDKCFDRAGKPRE